MGIHHPLQLPQSPIQSLAGHCDPTKHCRKYDVLTACKTASLSLDCDLLTLPMSSPRRANIAAVARGRIASNLLRKMISHVASIIEEGAKNVLALSTQVCLLPLVTLCSLGTWFLAVIISLVLPQQDKCYPRTSQPEQNWKARAPCLCASSAHAADW